MTPTVESPAEKSPSIARTKVAFLLNTNAESSTGSPTTENEHQAKVESPQARIDGVGPSMSDQDLARPGAKETVNGLSRLRDLIIRALQKGRSRRPSPNKTVEKLIARGFIDSAGTLTPEERLVLVSVIRDNFPTISDWQIAAWTQAIGV